MSRDRENIERFNQLAAEWDEKLQHVETGAGVAAAMLQALRLPGGDDMGGDMGEALEFGAGTGLVTVHLAPHLRTLLAMDGSSGMLSVLQRKCADLGLANVSVQEGLVPADLPDRRFDLIFSSLTLHHIEDSAGLLAALFQRLRPGGRVAFADLEAEDGSFHGDLPGVSHHGFARQPLRAQLEAAGFADVRFSPAHSPIHVIRRHNEAGEARDYPLFLVVAERPAG